MECRVYIFKKKFNACASILLEIQLVYVSFDSTRGSWRTFCCIVSLKARLLIRLKTVDISLAVLIELTKPCQN